MKMDKTYIWNQLDNLTKTETWPFGPWLGLWWLFQKDDVPDKVEAAFNKFDTDGNGFIDWSEFKQLASQLDPEQARRIFEACDSVRINK